MDVKIFLMFIVAENTGSVNIITHNVNIIKCITVNNFNITFNVNQKCQYW